MKYFNMCGNQVSQLGFGTMRFPVLENKEIDFAAVEKMVDYAIANGVNYFDTALPYHDGEAEVVIGKILKKYPKEKWFLADKYPGHQIADTYNPKEVFEDQLKKCGVEYFDFYLLHNVYENDIQVYEDPKWGIVDYFVEQKKLGRIKHLGFSTHGESECIESFLDWCDAKYGRPDGKCIMEFCQIEMNYLDWTLQRANKKYELLEKRNIPMVIMESVRGGKLANLSDINTARLKALRPDESIASWAFRYLQSFPGIAVSLSGMSNMEQLIDNVKTYSGGKDLDSSEIQQLYDIAESMKKSLPCTACRYCTKGCPMGLDIPGLLANYNDLRFDTRATVVMRLDALPADKLPSACIGCRACEQICPQKIKISEAMKDFTDRLGKMKSWAQICKEREEIEAKQKAGK